MMLQELSYIPLNIKQELAADSTTSRREILKKRLGSQWNNLYHENMPTKNTKKP